MGTSNQNQIRLKTIIEAREIGKARDGRLIEALLKEENNEYRLAYIVILKKGEVRKYRVAFITTIAYVLATCWYELKHKKGSFPDEYKPDWDKYDS